MSPGSFLWLVRHDLRLAMRQWRGMFGARGPVTIALVCAIVLIVFHVLSWPLARWFVAEQHNPANLTTPVLACAALFVLPWLIAQALNNTTRALYTRGDLDLLLASPVSARNVLAARALAIAIEAAISVGLFLLPVANMNALLGAWNWLALYPALMACGLFATSLGLLLTLGLFRLVGPRRTRFVAQVFATIIASVFVLGLQVANVLPQRWRDSMLDSFAHPVPGSLFDRSGPLWLPVRAAAGEPSALLIWCGLTLALFAATVLLLGRPFLESAMRTGGATATMRTSRRDHRFRAGAGAALRRKEWRLLARDPWLASQLLLQVIYTLPVSVVIWRAQGPGGSAALAVSPTIVVVAAQIAASLAWLAVSSEDAPDFIATAPVASQEIEQRKLEAIGLPLAVLLVVPLASLAWFTPLLAFWTAVFAFAAAASTALLNLWHPSLGRRGQVLRRHAQSKIVGLMEHMIALSWATAMVLVLLHSVFAVVPMLLVAGILWLNRPRRRPAAAAARARVAIGPSNAF